ncbi:hypothetical protein C0991_000970 [Blastosporella zonata]|nr:hypothetical protein C0991_000970 [Blastosporella zonata]
MKRQLQVTKERLAEAEGRVLQLEDALKEKTNELDAAYSFMNIIPNNLSGADITHCTNIFNADVLQCAAYIAGSSQKYRKVPAAVHAGALDQASLSLGDELLQEVMRERSRGSEAFFLQAALQICMVAFGENVLQTWSSDVEEDRITNRIYKRILSKETQGVSGSWRAVTRRSQYSDERDRGNKTNALFDSITGILIVAGRWNRAKSTAFFEKFQDTVSKVVDSSLKLRDAIGNMMHMDILPVTVPPGLPFCDEAMTSAYLLDGEDTGGFEMDYVLGTTQLGIKTSEGAQQAAAVILLKPEVQLHSMLGPTHIS